MLVLRDMPDMWRWLCDRQVVVPLPDLRGREQVLKVHMRKVPISDDVVAMDIARGTPGFSGADLANVVNEAALFAARQDQRLVAMRHFEQAKDKIMMGAERRSMVMTEEEKRLTAYHEGGHALVGVNVPLRDGINDETYQRIFVPVRTHRRMRWPPRRRSALARGVWRAGQRHSSPPNYPSANRTPLDPHT